ncbi:NAD(P)-binding protein [Dichomitus squalens]|uniref:NAD(P)-binding protein n=1 Tax=Dichomitus squalens TaxID=114155 RepID=A0A4Q9MIK3_9APHY|nr:NAD(P)-binding protein [Dichomitus squalens]
MPAITSGKILVTGANGYIAVWIVKSLLEAGFAVRGTVRSESKATYLRSYFKSFGDKFEVVVVSDITKEDMFAEWVKDVDAIAHTASPFHLNSVEPDEMIVPAVQGTLSVLKAAEAHGQNVKRIVVLSSTAAVQLPGEKPGVFDESAWNEASVAEVKEKGRDASPSAKYCASKTLAERAAWDWWLERKDKVPFDLTVLNPPFVFGPNIHDVKKPEEMGTSMLMWYNYVVKGAVSNETLANDGATFVDVRDIAEAHTRAFKTPAAGGQRFIICAGSYKYQEFVSAAHRWSHKLPAGNTSYDPSKAVYMISHDNRKGVETLGMKYHTIDETTRDSLEDFKARGWL